MTNGTVQKPLTSNEAFEFGAAGWENFYEKYFDRKVDLANVHIPPKPDYSCRAIVIVPDITNNAIFDACTKAFKTWRYVSDLNTITDVVKRQNGPYVVWVRDIVEADEDMKNKSANDIAATGINTLTLKERILLELKYFDETRKHLDIENWTLCAGSRSADGDVPRCRWHGVEFLVYWTLVAGRLSNCRARVAVS